MKIRLTMETDMKKWFESKKALLVERVIVRLLAQFLQHLT